MVKPFWVVYHADSGGGEETYLEASYGDALACAKEWADEDLTLGNDRAEIIVAHVEPVARVIRQVKSEVQAMPSVAYDG